MFFISKITWHEVSDKVDHQLIHGFLSALELSTYSSQIKRLAFFYVVRPPELQEVADDIYVEEDTLYISLNLDYEAFSMADEEETIALLTGLFLKGIDRIRESEIDFDVETFRKDVEGAFLVGSSSWAQGMESSL